MRPQRVDRFGPLARELLAGAEHEGPRLLFPRLRLHEAHGRAQRRLDDAFRVRGIVLLPLDERLDLARRDQFHLMAEPVHCARPVIRSATGLHRDDAVRML